MFRWFSARVFTLVFGIGYAVSVLLNLPLFRYYPLVQRFSLSDLTDVTLGPAMSWYGWIAGGLLPAILAALLVPNRLGARIPAAVLWLVPPLMLWAGWQHEQEWFRPAAP